MKKMFPAVALALAAVGSWAFYPKAAEPVEYMMVVSLVDFGSKDNSLSVVSPDGQIQEVTVTSVSRKTVSEDINRSEIIKLNQLRQAGWRVVSTSAIVEARVTGGMSSGTQTTYVLEK